MKKIFLVLFALIQSIAFCTEQTPDLLIIEKDTIYLKSFPLEELNFKILPYGEPPHSGCWRGYQAIWVLEDEKLYLKNIFPCDLDSKYLIDTIDIVEYFNSNGYEPAVKNNMIFADWFSGKFIEYYRNDLVQYYNGYLIFKPFPNEVNFNDILLSFIEGYLFINRL